MRQTPTPPYPQVFQDLSLSLLDVQTDVEVPDELSGTNVGLVAVAAVDPLEQVLEDLGCSSVAL